MQLNPEKCIFGVGRGKFLGFMITCRGVEANPNKCEAVIAMRSQQILKEVKKLIGRMTTLSRFLLKMVENVKPFFQLLKIANRLPLGPSVKRNVFQVQKFSRHSTNPYLVHIGSRVVAISIYFRLRNKLDSPRGRMQKAHVDLLH